MDDSDPKPCFMLADFLPRSLKSLRKAYVRALGEDYRRELHLHKLHDLMSFTTLDWRYINHYVAHAFAGFAEYTLQW